MSAHARTTKPTGPDTPGRARTTQPTGAQTSGRARTAKPAGAGGSAPVRITVNPVACTGHGVCAELLPERVTLDEWGYPIVDDAPVPAALTRQARRAVRDCPALALLLTDAGGSP
jgi:ferredoxin